MKEVIAVIRMNKMQDTKRAITEAGFSAFTVRKVTGRGQGLVDFRVVQLAQSNDTEALEMLPGDRDLFQNACSRWWFQRAGSSCSCRRSSQRTRRVVLAMARSLFCRCGMPSGYEPANEDRKRSATSGPSGPSRLGYSCPTPRIRSAPHIWRDGNFSGCVATFVISGAGGLKIPK